MITYKYYKAHNTLMVKLAEDVSLQDLVLFFDTVEKSLALPQQLNILMDSRATNTNFSIEEMKLLLVATEKKLVNFKEIRQALIIKSIEGTTSALFYRHINTNLKFQFEVFTTYTSAVNWLDLELSYISFINDEPND